MSLLHIDGSQGEGGGQIVRSSLAMSLVTGRPFVIENIRAGREKPGLMRQHLTAVKAATEIGQPRCGVRRSVRRGWSFGREGSNPAATLQRRHGRQHDAGAANRAAGAADRRATVELILEGGTHNPWAPPFDFLDQAFLPLIRRMGPQVTVTLENYGFYPAGGGRFAVQIVPQPRLAGFDLLERGPIQRRSVLGLVANLPRHIAAREVERILEKCSWEPAVGRVEAIRAHGPGNVVFAAMASEHVTEVFTGFGRTGASAEKVADEVVRQIRDYLGKMCRSVRTWPISYSCRWELAPGSRAAHRFAAAGPFARVPCRGTLRHTSICFGRCSACGSMSKLSKAAPPARLACRRTNAATPISAPPLLGTRSAEGRSERSCQVPAARCGQVGQLRQVDRSRSGFRLGHAKHVEQLRRTTIPHHPRRLAVERRQLDRPVDRFFDEADLIDQPALLRLIGGEDFARGQLIERSGSFLKAGRPSLMMPLNRSNIESICAWMISRCSSGIGLVMLSICFRSCVAIESSLTSNRANSPLKS